MNDLLKPRYEVIADFPQWSVFKLVKGDILTQGGIYFTGFTGGNTAKSINENEIDNYPAVLRKLSWWEHREEKEMPQYLKCVRTFRGSQGGFYELQEIHKVIKWDVNLPYTTNKEWIRVDYTIPATETEYLQYINKQVK